MEWDRFPGRQGKIAAHAAAACVLDHIPAQVDTNGSPAIMEIFFDKEPGAAPDIEEITPLGKRFYHVTAEVRMVAPAAGMIVVEIVNIRNIIVMLLNLPLFNRAS